MYLRMSVRLLLCLAWVRVRDKVASLPMHDKVQRTMSLWWPAIGRPRVGLRFLSPRRASVSPSVHVGRRWNLRAICSRRGCTLGSVHVVWPETCAKVIAQKWSFKECFSDEVFESTYRLRMGRLGGGLIGGPCLFYRPPEGHLESHPDLGEGKK